MSGFDFGFTFDAAGIEISQRVLEVLLNKVGDAFFVSPSGDDSNSGADWQHAFRTIDHAMNQCTSGAGDVILVAPGFYDETANGATGVECDLNNVTIIGVGRGVNINNTDTTNNGAVFTVTASFVVLDNLVIWKNEAVSANAAGVRFSGAFSCVLRDFVIAVDAVATHAGVVMDSFSNGIILTASEPNSSGILGQNVGIGLDFTNVVLSAAGRFSIGSVATGIRFRAGSIVTTLGTDLIITNCTTGVLLDAGAFGNIIGASLANCPTLITDNSGNATNSTESSLSFLREDIGHIPQFAGTIYFVNAATGTDTNSGLSPLTAFATISRAITVASAGDAITIRSGTYDENGLDLNKNGLQLWCETGVVFSNSTPGTVLAVSANDCFVRDLIISQAGQKAFDVTGDRNKFERCLISSSSVGFDLGGQTNSLIFCRVVEPSVCGFDIDADENQLIECDTNGAGGATTGFRIFGGADAVRLNRCNSTGHGTAGFRIESGSTQCLINRCASGGGDGDRRDDGKDNMWADFISKMEEERHSTIYPLGDGQGTSDSPILLSNVATDDTPDSRSDQDYWGDVKRIIPVNTITAEWLSIGIEIFADIADDIQSYQLFFPSPDFSTTRNGGNLWDLGETVLTVTSASLFQNGDKIWIASTSDPDGEILEITNIAGNVITIASETRASGNTGIRYNHTGAETMYLIERSNDPQWHSIDRSYSASTAKDFFSFNWHEPKLLRGNSGAIGRMLNSTDNGDSALSMKLVYED